MGRVGAAVARPPPDPVADGEGRPSVPRFGVLAAGQGDEMRERERARKKMAR